MTIAALLKARAPHRVVVGSSVCVLGLERIHQVTNMIRIAIQGGEYDTYREYTFSQRLN